MLKQTRSYVHNCIAATAFVAATFSVSGLSGAVTENAIDPAKESKAPSPQIELPQNATPPAWAPRAPLTLSEPARGNNFKWLGSQTTYTVPPVLCNGVNIGRLDFLYQPTYESAGTASNSGDMGGAALEGGFTANGNKPCSPDYKPNTSFKWLQMYKWDNAVVPPGAVSGVWNLDSSASSWPFYPYGSNDTNPAGGAFTASFYDGPRTFEPSSGNPDANCNFTLALTCTNKGKVNLIGSFVWGFRLASSTSTTDGAIGNTAVPPEAWLAPVTDSRVRQVASLLKGTKVKKGMAVSKGCCCPHPKAASSMVTAEGQGCIVFDVPEGDSIEAIAVFPRNHAIDWELFTENPGWIAEPSEFHGVPQLSYEEEPSEMYQEGVYLFPEVSVHGPQEFSINIPLTGHDSFFDIYLLNSEFEWVPWVQETDLLLGDMDGNGVHDELDIELVELTLFNMSEYQAAYPEINPVFAGDMDHDGSLSFFDVEILVELVEELNRGPAHRDMNHCPADLDGDGSVSVTDLLSVIAAWGYCDGCPEDINADGEVSVVDLLDVISTWGACSGG